MAKGFFSNPSGWSTKQYIAAALAGTIVVTAIVIIVSVVLQPADIGFTLTRATHTCSDPTLQMVLNLTIAANNTSSGRAKVHYRDVVVSLLYNSKQTVPVRVDSTFPFDQPPGNTTSMNASVRLIDELSVDLQQQMRDFKNGNGSAPVINARVTASVRFKIGLAITRTYPVVVTCSQVDFFHTFNTSTVNCIP